MVKVQPTRPDGFSRIPPTGVGGSLRPDLQGCSSQSLIRGNPHEWFAIEKAWFQPKLLLALMLLFTLCLSLAIQQVVSSQDRDDKGLQFRLSEGSGSAKAEPQPAIAKPAASPLPDAVTQRLLGRMRPSKAEGGDEKEFAIRERSAPPPRTGSTIYEPFPHGEKLKPAETDSSANLEIVRFAPEGEVEIAPHLSVTFSQPMVVVTSHEDLAASLPPVKVSPQPNGKWRWIGARTLLFETDIRFPMATSYAVEIPAGVKSATSGTLAETRRSTFTTPPLRLKGHHPDGDSQPRNPLLFAEFDQKIDRGSVLKHIRLRSVDREWTLRLATPEEIAHDVE